MLFSFLTCLCWSEESDQLTTRSGALDRVTIFCLSWQSKRQVQIKKSKSGNPFELGIRTEWLPNYVRDWPFDILQWDLDICHKTFWMNFSDIHINIPETQALQLALYGDVWNHHSMSSILHTWWTARCKHHKKGQMVYYLTGMENWQCGNQSYHVCHSTW